MTAIWACDLLSMMGVYTRPRRGPGPHCTSYLLLVAFAHISAYIHVYLVHIVTVFGFVVYRADTSR